MKKTVLFLVLIAVFLTSGCQSVSKADPEDKLNKIAVSATVNQLCSYYGYDADKTYYLYVPSGDPLKEPFRVTTDNETAYYLYLYFSTEMGYGGVNYPYNDGYITSLLTDTPQQEVSDKNAGRIKLNDYFYLEKANGIQVVGTFREVTEEEILMLEKQKEDILMNVEMLSEKEDFCGTVTILSNIACYNTAYNNETNYIELRLRDGLSFPVLLNGEPVAIMDYDPAGNLVSGMSQVITGHSDYKAISSHNPFILVNSEGITEDYVFEQKAPVIMAKAMPKALELASEAQYPHEILTFEINSDDLND